MSRWIASEFSNGPPRVAFAEPGPELARAVQEVLHPGPGFCVVTGVPCQDDDVAVEVFTRLSESLGELLPQTHDGSVVELVQDEVRAGYGGLRGAKSAGPLGWHTDAASGFRDASPDVFGLLCVRQAAEGGETFLLSAHEVLERLRTRRAEHMDSLREPVLWDRRGDVESDARPTAEAAVLTGAGSEASVRYNRFWIEMGHHRAEVPLGDAQREALDALDATLEEQDLRLTLLLEPGEALFVNNRTVLHGRTAFVDCENRPRLLLRSWLRSV